MQLVFADDEFPTTVTKTIFLAGPNPRYKNGDKIEPTWRHKAIDYLKGYDYDGHVFIPLPKDSFLGEFVKNPVSDYEHQIDWEDKAMARADVLLFYVDRRNGLQGLTTNIEFGRYLDSGRMVYGRPNNAESIRYLDEQVRKRKRFIGFDSNPQLDNGLHCSLKKCVYDALSRLGEGAKRQGGEVLVPLLFWKSPQFQTWYCNMCGDDNYSKPTNELRGFEAKSVITFNNGRGIHNNDGFLFGFSAWVNVYIKAEDREKSNEWIFSRTSTSYVAPYYIDEDNIKHFVLVREFRSPANNSQGYVYELPGGSSTDGKDIDPYENAQKELEEETGLTITDISRFRFLGKRQTFATFSINEIFSVAVELTRKEFEEVQQRAKEGTVLGENDEERIRLFIVTEKELQNQHSSMPVDYTTLGILWLLNNQTPIDQHVQDIAMEISDAEHGYAIRVLNHFKTIDFLQEDDQWSKEGLNYLIHYRLLQFKEHQDQYFNKTRVYQITGLGRQVLNYRENHYNNANPFGA